MSETDSSPSHSEVMAVEVDARRAGTSGIVMRSVFGSVIATLFLLIGASTLFAQPAWAHDGPPETEGYVMVQQAISHLLHDPSPNGTATALVRVNKALTAEDQDGVDIPLLEQAKADLEAGKPDDALPLLQESISEAIAGLSPATGEETGTTTVLPPLHGNEALSAMDWILLVLSAFVLLVGGVVAYLLRPKENLRQLGNDIRAARSYAREAMSVDSHGGHHDAN